MGKQPTMGQKKTKDQISKAASQRSKQSKKKWTKGKVKEKSNNAVYLEKKDYDNIVAQLPKMGRLVTVATLVEKFKVNGQKYQKIIYSKSSLARRVIKHFTEKGTLEQVGNHHNTFSVYTVSAAAMAASAAAKPVAETKAKAAPQKKK